MQPKRKPNFTRVIYIYIGMMFSFITKLKLILYLHHVSFSMFWPKFRLQLYSTRQSKKSGHLIIEVKVASRWNHSCTVENDKELNLNVNLLTCLSCFDAIYWHELIFTLEIQAIIYLYFTKNIK